MIAIPAGWRRAAGATGLVALALVLLRALTMLGVTVGRALGYPYDLDYGEGIVWQQMSNIVAGTGYAPLGTFPAIVYHYPPVYHLAVAGLAAATGLDPLVAGRGLSAASTLASMALIGRLAFVAAAPQPRPAALIGATAGALAFVAGPTVIFWSSLMRVDMLATALSLGGLCCTLRELRLPRRFPVAAILFALAVYTKQTAIVAPLAAFVTLLLVRPRAAWRLALTCGAIGVAALGVAMIATGGGFLTHVVSYNVNRVDLTRWYPTAATLGTQAAMLTVAAAVAWRARSGLRDRPAVLLLVVYLLFRVATLPLALKSGASDNYLIDLFSVGAALFGAGVAAIAGAVLDGSPWPRPIITIIALVAVPIQGARLEPVHQIAAHGPSRDALATLVARIRVARSPVISDYMILIRRAGRPVSFEPAIAAELAHSRLYDETALIRMIRDRRFAFFINQGSGDGYRQRYNPAVRAAIADAYPRIETSGELVIRSPVSRAGPAVSPRP